MSLSMSQNGSLYQPTVIVLLAGTSLLGTRAFAQHTDVATKPETVSSFEDNVRPLLKKYCLCCHNADTMESGIRVDDLSGTPTDRQLFLWKDIKKQIFDGVMPPEDALQPTAAQRQMLTDWISRTLAEAKRRPRENNGTIRRLTVAQYRNTLRDLLKLEDDLTDVLPADGVSKDGFLNNGQTLQLSPLLVEAYFEIAEKALDQCIVDERSKPVIQNFRMDFGAYLNTAPCPDELILGADSHLLKNQDFVVTQLTPAKAFDSQPYRIRTKYEFIEGYQGNDTVRGWKTFDSIYHSVFACMRGSEGYPKGKAYEVIPQGLLLRPAIPSSELFGQQSTLGPNANFKISLRELPDQGRFRVSVKAMRYDDGLLLESGAPIASDNKIDTVIADLSDSAEANLHIEEPGIYQVDVSFMPGEGREDQKEQHELSLTLGHRFFSGALYPSNLEASGKPKEETSAFMLVRLSPGPLRMTARFEKQQSQVRQIAFTLLDDQCKTAKQFCLFEKRSPYLSVHVGLRRDCGSTLTQVGEAQLVLSGELKEYVFTGAISNFPDPDVEDNNVNYLAGIREIGVHSEYTDGRDIPRLLIRSVEFEGPYYESWPPETHRNIFVDSDHKDNPEVYAREVIRSFAKRAYRRPIAEEEERSLMSVWTDSFASTNDFYIGVKNALFVVLTSPQFLFLIENSDTPQGEFLTPHELAAKLSYFLWDTIPDRRLSQLADTNMLHSSLDAEIERMTYDRRFQQFVREFTSQWLSLDKFDVLEVDRQLFPKLTRDTKAHLRNEPLAFLHYLIRENSPLRNLVNADFIVANDVVASYYELPIQTENGFEFLPVKHKTKHLGGVLSQAGILAGLSDGRHANPIKRGAWLARKIIAMPPDDPPPNVPALPNNDGTELSLREKLERHRNQQGCANCHSGIDPWGLPLEEFDASGLFRPDQRANSQSTLPDETVVQDTAELKAYLSNRQIDQVAFSFLKHLTIYATGRSLNYNEIEFLKEKGIQLRSVDYRVHDMIRFVIKSKLFLEK